MLEPVVAALHPGDDETGAFKSLHQPVPAYCRLPGPAASGDVQLERTLELDRDPVILDDHADSLAQVCDGIFRRGAVAVGATAGA
jgi:hypothetical protein